MKIKIKNKNKNESGWIKILQAVAQAIFVGVVVKWITSESFTPTDLNCGDKWRQSDNVIEESTDDADGKAYSRKIAKGVYLCCIKGRGVGYSWDYVVSKCLKDNSNS